MNSETVDRRDIGQYAAHKNREMKKSVDKTDLMLVVFQYLRSNYQYQTLILSFLCKTLLTIKNNFPTR